MSFDEKSNSNNSKHGSSEKEPNHEESFDVVLATEKSFERY